MASELNVGGITTTGNVGVGVTPEAWHSTYDALDIGEQGSLAAYNIAPGGSVFLGRNTYYDGSHKYKNTDEASLIEQSGDGRIKLRVAASGTADAAITWTDALLVSNTGLATFSAGINLGSTDLSSYEEGTWTPVVSGGTSAGTYTSDYRVADYTRIGRVVTVNLNLAWSSHTGTGDLTITGLPFTIKTSSAAIGTFQCNNGLSWTAGYLPALYASGTTILYRNTDDGGGAYQYQQIAAEVDYLRGTLTYFV